MGALVGGAIARSGRDAVLDYRWFAGPAQGWQTVGWVGFLHFLMRSCKNANMRTSLDFPDALFKHLKTRAAQEGRTLRDLVIELVERGLTAREVVDPQKRFDARPLIIPNQGPLPLHLSKMTNADLYELINEEDDERTIRLLGRG
jgi:hypothetical protein